MESESNQEYLTVVSEKINRETLGKGHRRLPAKANRVPYPAKKTNRMSI
ncbi:unnamed protein product [marine sediment metagenome]|uniref:Uncharacterized protein n=1 Tax=marine sediment metagenome TaxID=412755 RepID=X1F9J6_9ZZZZ